VKLFLISGFLGSGKTTAIKEACTLLLKNNTNVAVVTNDQGADLVDTLYLRSFGIPAEEVPNGCFCCNFPQLTEHIAALTQSERPDVIFAESVGSCTDLIATVARPLSTFYPETDVVITVFADASLLSSIIKGSSAFLNDEVQYIYKNQLTEADILVINKIDLIKQEELDLVEKVMQEDYRDKIILYQNSLNQKDIQLWLKKLNQFKLINKRSSLDIDYDIYATGEAMLAWLDEGIEITTINYSASQVAYSIIGKIVADLNQYNHTIGHLKFFIDNGIHQQKISYTTNTNDVSIQNAVDKSNKVSMLINARIQTDPDQLKKLVGNAIKTIAAQTNSKIQIKTISSFQPGYPNPTYRMAE
jgi:G3E family GTPase